LVETRGLEDFVNTEDAIKHLDDAVDHILAARVGFGVGDDVPEVPHEALDVALGAHEGYRDVRRQVRQALETLVEVKDPNIRKAAFAVEEHFNHLVSIAVEVGFAVGAMTRR